MNHNMLKAFFVVIFVACSIQLKAETLKVVTTEFPPFQFSDGANAEGVTTEIVKEVIKNAGFNADIKFYPWPRAYKIAQNEPNVIIYSIVRNQERESLLKWIGVIAPFDVYFWKLSGRADIKIEKFEDAKKYLVGGVHSDIKSAYLLKEGFVTGKNLTLVNSDELNLKMLYSKKIDILPADEYSFPYRVKMNGFDLKDFSRLSKINGIPNELSLAASLQTSEEIVSKLKKSLEEFHKSKKFKRLQKRIKS